MPLPRAATATQDQICPRRSSERKTTYRAASVPVGQREDTKLKFLRSKKPKLSLLDVEDTPPSSLPTVVIARGRKRGSSSCITPQADCVASTSASVADQIADASEQRPRKRHKRSLSTPPAPRTSQPPTQRQSRRLSRSRVGSPATDVEYVPPPRVSVRLSRRIQSLVDIRNSDIYKHLADPNGAGDLLSEPPVGSVISHTPSETVGPQSVKRARGRRRKITDLTDENTKKDLMEEWARLRQSQGTLPLSGINGNAYFSQTPLDDDQKGAGSISSIQLETMAQRSILDADVVKSYTTTIRISQSQEAMHDVPLRGSSPTRIDPGGALPVGVGAPEKTQDPKDSVIPSDGRTEQPTVPSLDIEAPSTSMDTHINEASSTYKLAGVPETVPHLDLLQRPGSAPPSPSALPLQENFVLSKHTESTEMPETKDVSLGDLSKDGHSVTCPKTYPLGNGNVRLDSDEEFHMLDIPEIFTLPWTPVTPHLYVPPSLGKLVSGMRQQLTMEAQARRKAEELYQEELSRRISAEKIIEELQTELEGRQKDSSGKPTRRLRVNGCPAP